MKGARSTLLYLSELEKAFQNKNSECVETRSQHFFSVLGGRDHLLFPQTHAGWERQDEETDSPFKIQAQHFSRKAGLETRTTQTGSETEGTQRRRGRSQGGAEGVSADKRQRVSKPGAAGPGPGGGVDRVLESGQQLRDSAEYINTGNTDLYF